MFMVNIDDPSTNNVLGFVQGTRKQFDMTYNGNPLWVFIDNDVARYRSDLPGFLRNPTGHYIDKYGNLRLKR